MNFCSEQDKSNQQVFREVFCQAKESETDWDSKKKNKLMGQEDQCSYLNRANA